MGKLAVVYWSGTGNTEAMAEMVAKGARDAGAEVDVFTATDFGAGDVDSYDAFAFGCPAMGAEELEDTEFLPMYDAVEPLLNGRKVILFGSYDWADGEWMQLWEQRASDAGLSIVTTVIAKDYPDSEAEGLCESAGAALAGAA